MHNYLRMCEKALQIQKDHKWSFGDRCAFRVLKYKVAQYIEVRYDLISNSWMLREDIDCDKPIWVPMEGQLRKISGLLWWKFDERCNDVRQILLAEPLGEIEVETKEEAGICVVMERYNRFWNGKVWIEGGK